MPIKSLIALLCCLLTFDGICCINISRTRINGKVYESPGEIYVPGDNPKNDSYLIRRAHDLAISLHEADSIYKITGELSDLSDYAALLIYNNRYAEAKSILLSIVKDEPGLYTTAANLGTLYELEGNTDSALLLIKKAVSINRASHDSSEWIHVKVLEAKMAQAANPDYLKTHSVLGLDFGANAAPDTILIRNVNALAQQLEFQLRERTYFIKPKDEIVGQLLFEYGNCMAFTTNIETALASYKMAHAYGYDSDLMKKRERHFNSLTGKAAFANTQKDVRHEIKRHPFPFILLTGGMGTLVVIVMTVRRRRKAGKSSGSDHSAQSC